MKTEEMLNEREKTHGDYKAVSEAWCGLTTAFDEHYSDSCVVLEDWQAAAIKMIFLKIARIVCGDPNFADHWDDIAGYAMLGKGEVKETPCKVCAISIECLGIPCDWHLQARCDELNKMKETEENISSKVELKDRYAEGWNDGVDSAQAIYSNMKKENEQLKEENKNLLLDVMRAHDKGIDATAEYYESIFDDVKTKRWVDPKKAMPPKGSVVIVLYAGKVYENATVTASLSGNPSFSFVKDTCTNVIAHELIDGWVYPETSAHLDSSEILKKHRIKDIQELKAKYSTSSKMEHVQEENPKCSDCGKVLYAASVVKLPCIGQEKFLCFRCAGLAFKECPEEKKKEGDERICCVCKKEAETGKLKAYKLCVDCWRTDMINVSRETITGGF